MAIITENANSNPIIRDKLFSIYISNKDNFYIFTKFICTTGQIIFVAYYPIKIKLSNVWITVK